MKTQLPRRRINALLAAAVLLSLVAARADSVQAQVGQGATLTVNSGTVAVTKANGSAMQPAPSGMTLGVGDRIATVTNNANALVTFFEGSELELEGNTTIILREVAQSGSEVRITVEDVLGTTVNRINAFVNPNSLYTVQNPQGQVLALIRGSTVRFQQFDVGGVLVRADCHVDCQVVALQDVVCEGKSFVCGVDPQGGVTDDPGYGGGPISQQTAPGQGQDSDSGGGGTIGGP
jgi:hypothetical protein